MTTETTLFEMRITDNGGSRVLQAHGELDHGSIKGILLMIMSQMSSEDFFQCTIDAMESMVNKPERQDGTPILH